MSVFAVQILSNLFLCLKKVKLLNLQCRCLSVMGTVTLDLSCYMHLNEDPPGKR